ncbi:hypothetical protein CONLIGDRAFT_656439 [Coniochaeta ligniaria NRRL 30616]|uniref:F-box domain-containing protein n=1 Tax=Coniochaeta ligniaria NRRL 30616 TaxID=1408157 RepID=A0A1J7J7D8_9PEZI|nr:hypothetical protein CONLIGDRAFT_656439 [Coniochaeta ligniaria NRRL 30616]
MNNEDVLADVEKHANAIIRVCSGYQPAYGLLVIRPDFSCLNPVHATLDSAFDTPPTAELGTYILGRLPAELKLMVLRELDILSFFRFRHVSRRARELSTGLWEYNLVAKHGREGLRGLLRAGLAHRFTICDLYQPLITEKCSTCDAFGGLLFLLTAERCCFTCLQSKAHYHVISPRIYAMLSVIHPARLNRKSIPSLRTVSGRYTLTTTPVNPPKRLILAEHATQALLAAKVIKEDVIQVLRSQGDEQRQRYMATTLYPWYNLKNARPEYGAGCRGCQPPRGLYLDDQAFSARGFLSHFSQCAEAQRLWAESEGGTGPLGKPECARPYSFHSFFFSNWLAI